MTADLKNVIASFVGSILEMYDFVIYGFFATVIATLFFPKSDHFISLVATFAIFAIGYFSRPIGGILFAHISDRYGRKQGLIYSTVCMGLAIFLLAITPTYASIGVAAPILLLIFRIFQGLSVGGEFPSATTFLAEHAKANNRGFVASWVFFGINLGIVLACAVGTFITFIFSQDQIMAWGWRIPFLFGCLLAIISYFIRKRLSETSIFLNEKTHENLPVKTVFMTSFKPMIIGLGLICIMAAAIGTVFLYAPTYLHGYLKLSLSKALLFNTISIFIFAVLIPIVAIISDKIGRKPIFIFGCVLFILFSYPLYAMVATTSSDGLLLLGLVVLGAFTALIIGPIAAILSELYMTATRATGMAISYNISFAIFGGVAPVILTTLLSKTGDDASPAYYLIITAIVSLVFVLFMREGRGVSLGQVDKNLK